MKNQLRRLNAISRILDLQMFYTINYTSYRIRLQGEHDAQKVTMFMQKKFKPSGIDKGTGFLTLIRGSIEITLT